MMVAVLSMKPKGGFFLASAAPASKADAATVAAPASHWRRVRSVVMAVPESEGRGDPGKVLCRVARDGKGGSGALWEGIKKPGAKGDRRVRSKIVTCRPGSRLAFGRRNRGRHSRVHGRAIPRPG